MRRGRVGVVTNWPELEERVGALGPEGRILEAGTGRGALLTYLLDLLEEGGHRSPAPRLPKLVSADIDPAAVSAARNLLARRGAAVRSAVQLVEADITELVRRPGPRFSLLVTSAFLSAVPLWDKFGLDRVLAAFRQALLPGGRLLIEDYLPLKPPTPAGLPPDAAELARRLWRLDRAAAELNGAPHHEELPPSWLAGRLKAHGFANVSWVFDERQQPRSDDTLAEVLQAAPRSRPAAVDPALWLALDRYRRDLYAQISRQGLTQWSGSFRMSAMTPVSVSTEPVG
jgi:SAM-dependent methyltransferase